MRQEGGIQYVVVYAVQIQIERDTCIAEINAMNTFNFVL